MGATTTEGTGAGAVENSWPRIQNNIKPENTTSYKPESHLTAFSGDLLIGTLHPNESDAESVIWADANTEYVGLWYGGQRDLESGYGPDVSITVGNESLDDNIGTYWNSGLQVNIDVGDNNWHFGNNGILNIPNTGNIKYENGNEIWIKISTLKTIVANSADFNAFKTAIATL